MLIDLLFIIFIFWIIFKKKSNLLVNSDLEIETILRNEGFLNITPLIQNQSGNMLKADLHGENYLIKIMQNAYPITSLTINEVVDYASKEHFHNIIIISGNSIISDSAKPKIEEYNIDIWDNKKINRLTHDSDQNLTEIIKTSKLDDDCVIDEPEEPIQDGKKANTILGNIFNNKIQRL